VVLLRVVDAHRRDRVVELRGRLVMAAIFFNALIRPTGLRVSSTPLASASDSRSRDSASCISGPTRNAMIVKMIRPRR